MDWLESIPWAIIPSALVAFFVALGFYWNVIPEEKKYWWLLRLGLKRPTLSIEKAGGVKIHEIFTQRYA